MAEEKKVSAEINENDLVVPLRKAIVNSAGDEIKEIRFREPTAADIERCGTPVMFDIFSGDVVKMNYDIKAMFAMMSSLSMEPPSVIKKLSTKDWEFAALRIATAFFIPD